jgi:U1 small nuclear ribonucleoprotein
LPYLPPIEKKEPLHYTGIGRYIQQFEDPAKVDYSQFRPIETKQQIKERKARERAILHEQHLQELIKEWDPTKNEKATSDPLKTLFVSRINFQTTESKLKREFDSYGTVKRVRLINDIKSGKPIGYGFIEFDRKSEMQTAYKQADGKKIDGRRVLVDYERGRTVRNWRPRRLGGGLGATRAGGADVNQKFSGREPPSHSVTRERDTYRPERKDREKDREKEGGERNRGREGREREKGYTKKDKDKDRYPRERSKSRERHRSRSREQREQRDQREQRHRSRSRERHSHRR